MKGNNNKKKKAKVVREKMTELGEEDAWFSKVVYFGKGKGAPKFKMTALYPPNLRLMN